MSHHRAILWSVSLLMLASLVGCGEPTSVVSGNVLVDNTPVQIGNGRTMKVTLTPLGTTAAASVTPVERAAWITSVTSDGGFAFPEIRPGRYAVRVSDFIDSPSKDGLANHFKKHPDDIVWDVRSDQETFDIPLQKAWFKH